MKIPVKIQRDSDGQFVCIPPEFKFPFEEAILRKVGDKLIMEPAPKEKPLPDF